MRPDPMNPWTPDYPEPPPEPVASPEQHAATVAHLRKLAAVPDNTTPDPAARGVAELALSSVLAVAQIAVNNSGQVDATVLDTDTLVDGYNALKGTPGTPDPGIIAQLNMVARALETEIVARIPRDANDRPQKWTDVGGWRLERLGGNEWHIDSKKALDRLFDDVAVDIDEVPANAGNRLVPLDQAVDVVLTHIGSLETSWRTTELEASLGGKIEVPVLDDDGNPVVITRGPNKGQPKTKKVSRIEAEEFGEARQKRTTIKVHPADAGGAAQIRSTDGR